MAKVTKVIGTIAGIAAMIPGPWQPIAAAVAVVANVATTVLQKKPAARGTVNNILISPEAPSPYLIGRTYAGGVLRYDNAWGGKVGKVWNPYRTMVTVYSVAGPLEQCEGYYTDFTEVTMSAGAATGYYANFMWTDVQLGARPESNQLSSHWAGQPGWGSTSKLSSKAAISWSLLFDKDGKRFASGVPQLGAVWKGVKVYDPRLDGTYPGGTGAHRIDDEDTWEYSDTPALHALAYTYGRYVEGVKVMGIGMPVEGIDLASFVAGANVEEANGWTVGGVIFEPGDRWQNLKDICAAGSAEPVFAGGRISYKQDAPRVSLATVTNDDLGEGPITVRAMQTWRDRLNTIVPKYRSEAHKWEYVSSDEVSVSTYVTEDGERKVQEIQWNLVQDLDQVAQLAAYRLVNGRELVIDCTLKPDFRFYQPGDMLTFDLADAGLDGVGAVMVSRTIDPATLAVTARFIGETSTKHSYALGKTGTAPPTPSLLSPEDRDDIATTNNTPAGYDATLIATSHVSGLGGNPVSATDAGSNATINIAAHDRVYSDKTVAISSGSLTGKSYSTLYLVYYDDAGRDGGSVTYVSTTDPTLAYNSSDYPDRHFVGYVTTPSSGGPDTGGGGSSPSGWGGGVNAALP